MAVAYSEGIPFQATEGSDVSVCLFKTVVAMDGEIASSQTSAIAKFISRNDKAESFPIFLHLKLSRVVVAYREFHL
ncbi:hypothetical protein OB69_09460 [Roseivirga seohaensis subsp. aquiponti]|uniref:Uncharacterized protein n=1 Tax=Roseivirga seohaensis subsp. aquiponti TaxID=1566026 RepID=A0A0L8ALB1_9BACT|nr:hypothetical protein [Roseivirga seohaensis]KOF03036.1 hypothetical protein OB69_09460 [Roseivirga seohaensis subsp. aquiponti]